MSRLISLLLLLAVVADDGADNRLARDIYRELIETDTTNSSGDTTKAAVAMAARLKSAGLLPNHWGHALDRSCPGQPHAKLRNAAPFTIEISQSKTIGAFMTAKRIGIRNKWRKHFGVTA